MRAFRTSLFAAAACAALAACAPGEFQQTADRDLCVPLFRQFDLYAQTRRDEVTSKFDGRRIPNPNLQRISQQLIQNDCQTRPRDLAPLDATRDAWKGRTIVESGPPAPYPGTVHAGALTGEGEVALAVNFFESLGIPATSIGSSFLGRRVYIGPFATQGGIEDAIELAREAGFVAPYASQFFRF
jgi:hypothetical protein